MRILFTTDTYFPVVSGVTTVVRSLATALQAQGHDIALIAPAAPATTQDQVPFALFSVPSVRNPIRPDHFIPLLHVRRIQGYVDTFAPQLIHAHTPGPIALGVLGAASKNHIPVVATCHGVPGFVTSYITLPSPITHLIESALWAYTRWILNSLTHIVAPSEFIKNELTSHGVTKNISVIPMWIDPPSSGTRTSQQALRARWHIPKNTFVFLYFGRLEPDKNLMTLLQAFVTVQKQTASGQKPFLFIVGRGTEASRLANFIASHIPTGARLHTMFLNHKQIEEMYLLSDVFVMPGPFEAQSIVTLEAVAHRRKVIVANSGALPEITRRFPIQCTRFEALSSTSLARAMQHAMVTKTPTPAPTRFLEFYKKTNVVSQYIVLYNRLTG